GVFKSRIDRQPLFLPVKQPELLPERAVLHGAAVDLGEGGQKRLHARLKKAELSERQKSRPQHRAHRTVAEIKLMQLRQPIELLLRIGRQAVAAEQIVIMGDGVGEHTYPEIRITTTSACP